MLYGLNFLRLVDGIITPFPVFFRPCSTAFCALLVRLFPASVFRCGFMRPSGIAGNPTACERECIGRKLVIKQSILCLVFV